MRIVNSHLKREVSKLLLLIFIGILFGSVFYLFLYGKYHLYFTHVYWIYRSGSDNLQHQLGWEFFRQTPWRFPLGRIEAYGYPFGTYVSYLDSIPLLAIPFKILSPFLGGNFQYIGIWELFSIIGQMVFGMLILSEFTRSYPLKIIGAALLVLSTPMMNRAFGHSSLTAHWIILAGIWFVILEHRHRLWKYAWLLLFSITPLIHLYYIPMLTPLWLVSLFFKYRRSTKKRWLIIDFLSVVIGLIIIGYSIGLFSLQFGNLGKGGFGLYSWNLNSFFNPMQYSSLLIKSLPIGPPGQGEGYSYLGLGFLVMLPVATLFFIQNEFRKGKLKFFLPFALISIGYVLYALSNQAYLNNQLLWNISLSEPILKLFSFFRASARLIWPVYYFLVLLLMITIIRYVRFPVFILTFCFILQLFDIQEIYKSKRLNGFIDYKSPLQSEFWEVAPDFNDHLVMIPAIWGANIASEPIALYARKNDFTLNYGYFSRADYDKISVYGDKVLNDLLAGTADDRTVYIFWETEDTSQYTMEQQKILAQMMISCEIDGYNVFLSQDNEMTERAPTLLDDCQKPAD